MCGSRRPVMRRRQRHTWSSCTEPSTGRPGSSSSAGASIRERSSPGTTAAGTAGRGRTTVPFTIDEQVADLVEVIGHSSPGDVPTVVVGHSYGGNVALAAVDRRPGLIDGVVTYEVPMSWLSWWTGQAGSDALEWQHDPEEAAERFMRRLIGDARWERLPSSTREARRAEGVAMIGELTDLRERQPWHPERITVPVSCLCGEHARPNHRRGAAELSTLLPDARLVEVEGAHHFGPNTHPDAVAAVVIELVDRISRSRS